MLSIEGLDELKRELEKLETKAQELSGTQNVPISTLLTPEFLQSCSQFHSVGEMFDASGFSIDSPKDFEAISDTEWDEFIRSTTSYSTWEEMLNDAVAAWTKEQLGL